MAAFREYEHYDALGLAELIRKGEVHPIELVEAAIERIEARNPTINAVIHTMYDQALAAARGPLPETPLAGVPFLLKDLGAFCAGEPMRSGSRFLQDFVPDHDSELVRRYKNAGLIILGKTNVPELGLMPTTEPELFGPCRNPWDTNRIAGGSSGGSAAAVAARMVPAAHGNDGGGSIRIPAACCGVFGLKPTRGRIPMGPDIGEAWQGFAIDHVLTLTVRDSAALLDATAGPDVGAPYYPPPAERPFLDEIGHPPGRLRIAFTAEPLLSGKVDAACVRALESTVALCRDLGHELIEDRPQVDADAFAQAFLTMVAVETRATIDDLAAFLKRKPRAEDFEPGTWAMALLAERISGAEFARAVGYLKRTARQIAAFFERYDILLTPTLASPPLRLGQLMPDERQAAAVKLIARLHAGWLLEVAASIDELARETFEFIPFTPIFNVTGQPAMSVPLEWTEEGLPIGMHFVGRFGDEATLFRLAAQLEQARPWFERVPPLCQQQPVSQAQPERS